MKTKPLLIFSLLLLSIFANGQTELYSNDAITVSYEAFSVKEGKKSTQYRCIQTVKNNTGNDLYYEDENGAGVPPILAGPFMELKILNSTGLNSVLRLSLPESEYTTVDGLNALRVLKANETFTKENYFKVANGDDPLIRAYPSKELRSISLYTVDLSSKSMDGKWSSKDGQNLALTYTPTSIKTTINSISLVWNVSSNNTATSTYSNTLNPNSTVIIDKVFKTITIETAVGLNTVFEK